MNMQIALEYLRPAEEWSLDGETYEGLTWLSDTKKPSEKEIEAAFPAALAEHEAKQAAEAAARADAIAHAKSLGFTDAMIAVMYPNLGAPNV